jgi:hypothetical protein
MSEVRQHKQTSLRAVGSTEPEANAQRPMKTGGGLEQSKSDECQVTRDDFYGKRSPRRSVFDNAKWKISILACLGRWASCPPIGRTRPVASPSRENRERVPVCRQPGSSTPTSE